MWIIFSSSLLWHGCRSCLSLISLTGFQNSQVFHIPVRRIPDSEDEMGWFLLIRTSGDMGKVTRNTLLLYSDYKALGCYNIVSLSITNIIYCYTSTWTDLDVARTVKNSISTHAIQCWKTDTVELLVFYWFRVLSIYYMHADSILILEPILCVFLFGIMEKI